MTAPRKSLGQNFLTDKTTARAVVKHGKIGPESEVLEIGPGKGFLTRALVAAGADVVAVEKDRILAARLPGRFPEAPLRVIEGDFLEVDLEPFVGRILVGNLPYNVAMPILSLALAHHSHWPRLIFMFQLEVAQRLCAEPGTRAYGMPTLVANVTHRTTQIRKVPAGAFFPKPKVDSALVSFEPLEAPLLVGAERLKFLDLMGNAFRYRRKTATNGLARASHHSSAEIAAILDTLGHDSRVRLETLSVGELVELWLAL
jgi:16S rRNA (adenine1518-N6/adenine1519-N6)-dimethyltransferase